MKTDNIALKTKLVPYTTKQEKFNHISHLIGVPLGALIFVVSIIMFILGKLSVPYFIGLSIFSFTAISLYSISASYHKPNDDVSKKRVKRVIDHCTIYALIAGTYTPICIYLMSTTTIGLTLLVIQWLLAIIGIMLNAYDLDNPVVKTLSMILYIAMGWMILYTAGFVYLPKMSFIWILAGGIIYTIGSILYGIGHSKMWFHSVFHVFVLLGTLSQAIGVFFLFI